MVGGRNCEAADGGCPLAVRRALQLQAALAVATRYAIRRAAFRGGRGDALRGSQGVQLRVGVVAAVLLQARVGRRSSSDILAAVVAGPIGVLGRRRAYRQVRRRRPTTVASILIREAIATSGAASRPGTTSKRGRKTPQDRPAALAERLRRAVRHHGGRGVSLARPQARPEAALPPPERASGGGRSGGASPFRVGPAFCVVSATALRPARI